MLSAFLKNSLIPSQWKGLIMVCQSWDFENLSDFPWKSESGAKSESSRRPPWPRGSVKGWHEAHTHPLGFLSQQFISSQSSLLNVWTFKIQCFPRSHLISLLGLTPAVPCTPAYTPKYHAPTLTATWICHTLFSTPSHSSCCLLNPHVLPSFTCRNATHSSQLTWSSPSSWDLRGTPPLPPYPGRANHVLSAIPIAPCPGSVVQIHPFKVPAPCLHEFLPPCGLKAWSWALAALASPASLLENQIVSLCPRYTVSETHFNTITRWIRINVNIWEAHLRDRG